MIKLTPLKQHGKGWAALRCAALRCAALMLLVADSETSKGMNYLYIVVGVDCCSEVIPPHDSLICLFVSVHALRDNKERRGGCTDFPCVGSTMCSGRLLKPLTI